MFQLQISSFNVRHYYISRPQPLLKLEDQKIRVTFFTALLRANLNNNQCLNRNLMAGAGEPINSLMEQLILETGLGPADVDLVWFKPLPMNGL